MSQTLVSVGAATPPAQVTYMDFSGADSHGILASQLEELASAGIPGDLSRIKVFSSLDNKLAFNIFTFDQVTPPHTNSCCCYDTPPPPTPFLCMRCIYIH